MLTAYGSARILARSWWYCSGVISSALYWRSNSGRRCSLSAEIGKAGASNGGKGTGFLGLGVGGLTAVSRRLDGGGTWRAAGGGGTSTVFDWAGVAAGAGGAATATGF